MNVILEMRVLLKSNWLAFQIWMKEFIESNWSFEILEFKNEIEQLPPCIKAPICKELST